MDVKVKATETRQLAVVDLKRAELAAQSTEKQEEKMAAGLSHASVTLHSEST